MKKQNVIQVNRFSGWALNKYGDSVSLMLVRPSESGLFYDQWGRLRIGKDKFRDGVLPWAVLLGEDDKSVRENIGLIGKAYEGGAWFVRPSELRDGGDPF